MAEGRILIVEDEGIEALDLEHRLTSLGYAVLDIVATGEEAVKKAGELLPDLILMDIMLQGKIDGVTAAGQIRPLLDIPVIFLTAYADEKTLDRAKVTEPYGYLVKPFQEKELHIAIRMALYKHRMDRKLKENERFLATTMRSIGDGVITTDPQGLITFMNPVAEGLMGWQLAEVAQKKLTDVFKIINRDSRQDVENPVTKVLREGVIVGLANHTLLIARDGREIPIDDSGAPIRDDQGKMTGAVLIFRDITKRERAEEAARRSFAEADESRRILNAMMEHIPMGISLADAPDVRTRAVSRFGLEMIGRPAEQIKGIPVDLHPERWGFFHTDGVTPARSEELPLTRATLHGEVVPAEEWAFVRPDGTRLPILCTAAPILDGEGRITGGVIGWQDISERKRAEGERERLMAELARSNNELKQFAAIASHDLQAPLRSIKGFLELLSRRYRGKLGPEADEFIGFAVEGAVRMQKLIDDILALSRVGTNGKHFERVESGEPLAEALENLQFEIEESRAEVTCDELPVVTADRNQLTQLFQNLIGNAIKYRKIDAPPRIHIASEEQEDQWEFRVRDNGIGFDQQFAERTFQIFQRLHTVDKYPGTGIGLAICKKIIDRHRGRIWAESEPGKGSTFYFTLPKA